MSWKIGDLCVTKSKQFGWTNSEIKQINTDVAHVEFIEYEGDEEVNISDIKLFGPFVVNKIGELVEGNNDAGDYIGWKVGDACVAQWTQDGAWYNSEILHFFSEDEILVRFVDYGNADFTTLGNLRPAGSPLENTVCQSRKSSSINDSKTEVRQRTMKLTSLALEEKRSENTTRPWRVFDKCVSRWSVDGLWYMSQILAITGQQVTVLFTQYGNEAVTTLNQLKHVNALEECDEIKTSWKVGDLCVALWNEDNVWYNSQIVEIKGDRVLVRFTDYGNEDYTTLDQLKPFGSLDGELVEAIFTPVKKTLSSNERVISAGTLPSNAEGKDTPGQLKPAGSFPSNAEGMDTRGRLKPAGSLPSNAEGKDTLGQLKPAGSLPSKDTLGQLKSAGSLPSNAEGMDKEKTWAVGDLCVARWEEDQVWYNSKIMEIHEAKALVQFVDYGNEDFARLSQLKPTGILELEDFIKEKGGIPQCKGAIRKVSMGAISKIKKGSSSEKQLPTSEKKAATEEDISAAKGRINVPKATSQKKAATVEGISAAKGRIIHKATSQKKAATEEEINGSKGKINAFGRGRARGHPDTSQYSIRNDGSTPENIAEQLENIFPYFSPEFLLDQARKYGTIENAANELLNYVHDQALLKEKEDDNNCVKERVAKSLLLLNEQDMFEKVTLTEKRDFNPEDPLENKFRLAKGQYLSVSDQLARPIESIDYVENRILMEIFERKRSQFHLEGKDTKEYFLFHGTDDVNVESILRENFQMDYAGKHGQAHGRGIYFSEKTEIPDEYMNGSKKKLLLCRVLLGREFLGVASDIPEGFDSKSVQPDEDKRADINVIKEVDQILPCFVLNLGSSAVDHFDADQVSFRRPFYMPQYGASSAIPTNSSQYGASSATPTYVPQYGASSAIPTNMSQYGASSAIPTNMLQYGASSAISTNMSLYGASSVTPTIVASSGRSIGSAFQMARLGLASCPYDTSHKVRQDMMQIHITKCSKRPWYPEDFI